MANSVKRLAKAKIKHIQPLPCPPSLSSHCRRLPGLSGMISTSSIWTMYHHLLFLHMFVNYFRDYLLHHLPRNQREAHWAVTPWIFLPVFPKDRSDICYLQVLRHLPWSLQCFEDDCQWPHNDLGQFPQHLQVYVIRAQGHA